MQFAQAATFFKEIQELKHKIGELQTKNKYLQENEKSLKKENLELLKESSNKYETIIDSLHDQLKDMEIRLKGFQNNQDLQSKINYYKNLFEDTNDSLKKVEKEYKNFKDESASSIEKIHSMHLEQVLALNEKLNNNENKLKSRENLF